MKSRLLFQLLMLSGILAIHGFAWAEQPCLRIKEVWSSQNSLQQASSLDIELRMVWERSSDCDVLRDLILDRQASTAPNGLQADTGLTMSKASLVDNKTAGGGQDVVVKARIAATGELPVGRYSIPVLIRYQALGQNRQSMTGQIPVDLPIEVVDAHAHVKQNLHSPLDSKWNLIWQIPAGVGRGTLYLLNGIVHPQC